MVFVLERCYCIHTVERCLLSSQAGIMREQRLRQDLHRQMEETKEEMKARVCEGRV